jgi:hypothetical protein
LEKDWVAAIQKKDTAALDRILAPDFIGTSSIAHTFMKEDAIGDIKDSRYVVDKMDLDEVSVTRLWRHRRQLHQSGREERVRRKGYQRLLSLHRYLGEEGRQMAGCGFSRHSLRQAHSRRKSQSKIGGVL